ncbi:MAG TPA: hypothetical protein VL551_11335 [Actinospica sp.]|nr:hypothetical protein [Actinospica sp.]
MRPDDFYITETPDLDAPWGPNTDPLATSVWGSGTVTSRTLDTKLLDALRCGPVAGRDDIEVASALARLIHDDLERYGTDGTEEMSEPEIRIAIIALRAVVDRVGVFEFKLPFRDYGTFRGYWVRNDCYGSWQARRDILNKLFDPLHDGLVDLETRALSSTLAQAISPRTVTGWARVDEELAELRRHFQNARTEQDYRNVGNDCVIVTEALSRQVYNPKVHLRRGEDEPPVAQTKNRIDRYIEDALPGPDNAALRKLAKSAIEFAQRVKHSSTSTRREAGVAADAVILLANILRRLDESA